MTATEVVAVLAILIAIGLGIALWISRRRPASVSDAAGELVEAHRAGARERRDANYAAAVAAGEKAVVDVDAAADERVANAGSFADLMDELDSGAE